MSNYQTYKGNPENKLFYIVDQLVGGINTDFSDDTSSDNEFSSIVNFSMDKRGSLYKRMGFGKLNAVSEIFNRFTNLPVVKGKTDVDTNPEDNNDNIVYVKMLINDKNCFRNLSAFSGDKAYREYQKIYGSQNNSFKILMITTNKFLNTSTAWLYSCSLPALQYDTNGQPTDVETIVTTSNVYDLPVIFTWDRNLANINTIEFFDKIYFTTNNKGLVCFDRKTDTFSYSGTGITGQTNKAYKPSPMEVRKIGFNVLGDDPLHWVDYKGITTDSIQGVYLSSTDNKPLTVVPSGGKFRLNILYTGSDSGFTISYKEGETTLTATNTANSSLSASGLKVYDVAFQTVPTSQVEIKITKTGASIDPYYDYYEVGQIDPETKAVSYLNIGDYSVCEMYNRAVYYKDDTIWFSELNNFNYIPNYNYVSLPIEPTDKITKIVFFKNVYIVFTKQRIYKMLNAFGTDSFQVMPVNLAIGCHAPETVIPIQNELYFASPRGLYSLKSSEFRDGIENLNELDSKVKKLTADVTMYLSEKTDPAVRYNGISERAYAFRYKDKYMLFYNTTYQQGDIAALKNLDVLVYQYDMRAFSEIKFPIKPTFLFFVDGAIETFMTVPEKEDYSVEQSLINYDFENDAGTDRKITDLSGNNNNADMVGGTILAPGTGVILNDDNAFIKMGIINSNVNLVDGFSVKIKCQMSEVDNTIIYSLKQATPSGQTASQSFVLDTNWNNGYRGELSCLTSPNSDNMTDTIYWTFRWQRDSTARNGTQSGNFWLKDNSNGSTLISDRGFNFNMGNNLSQDVATGSFVINHDSNGNYSKAWRLSAASYYPTYSTGYDNGPTQYFDVTQYSSWSSYFGIRMVGRAEAHDGGCNIYYTPYFHIQPNAKLQIGARTLYAWINGTQHNHDMPSISVSSSQDIDGGEQSQSIGYTGQPTIGIDAQFNIRATINGSYHENLDIDGFNFTLPYSNPYTITNWNWFSVDFLTTVTLNQILKPSYKEISLSTYSNNEHLLNLVCESSYQRVIKLINNDNMSVSGIHEWNVVYTKQSNNYLVSIYQDNVLFGSSTFDLNTITNANRDNSVFGYNMIGSITNFTITLKNNTKVLDYDFEDGRGTILTDKSGNNLNGTLNGTVTWAVEKGLKFDGKTGYLNLPELENSIRFTNGFSIEFEAKFDNVINNCKIIDLATSYDITDSAKAGIYAGITSNSDRIEFRSTSVDNKVYNLSKENAILTSRHKWKFSLLDNGKGYNANLYCDGTLVKSDVYKYGGISNIKRKSNFIGKSNDIEDSLFSGMLYNLKLTIYASANPVPTYASSVFEYDTTYDDFGKPMELELQTKGINLKYPMHFKKLKNIFVKGLGGFNYNNFYFEVYVDGHLVNNPKTFNCYLDEATGQVIYDYTDSKILTFNEASSMLGNMRLSHTKLGESTYETKKLVIPCKGKNFTLKIYGESSDSLGIESFGFVFKLGKVREE